MDDLISRQAAIDFVGSMNMCDEISNEAYKKLISYLDDLPSAQPERKTGKWLPQDHNKRTGYVTTTVYYYPKCSECGHTGNYGMNYCPNCGADMRGEQP